MRVEIEKEEKEKKEYALKLLHFVEKGDIMYTIKEII